MSFVFVFVSLIPSSFSPSFPNPLHSDSCQSVFCNISLENVRVIFFSRLLEATPTGTRHKPPRTQNYRRLHCYLVFHTPSLCAEKLIINYTIPTNVKEVCVSPFCFLSNFRDFTTLLSPISFINHQ